MYHIFATIILILKIVTTQFQWNLLSIALIDNHDILKLFTIVSKIQTWSFNGHSYFLNIVNIDVCEIRMNVDDPVGERGLVHYHTTLTRIEVTKQRSLVWKKTKTFYQIWFKDIFIRVEIHVKQTIVVMLKKGIRNMKNMYEHLNMAMLNWV